MAKAIELDLTNYLDKFNKLSRDMPFIISKSLNDIAFTNARKDVSKDMASIFIVRDNTFSSDRSIKINKSSKNNLTVTIYHFKQMLSLQQFGGTESPTGKSLAIPIRGNLAKYAGVPNNKKIPKALSIPVIMDKAPRKRGEPVYKVKGVQPFILKRGVFVRQDGALRMLYSFVDKATHEKKLFKFQQIIEKTYNVKLERNIERNYLKVLSGR